MNKEEYRFENDKFNLSEDFEYFSDEYYPGGNYRVYMPDKWWHSEINWNPFSEKKLNIVKINRIRKNAPKTLLHPGWDIKKGDYKVNLSDDDLMQEFKKSDRNKIYIYEFIVTFIVVVLIVLYVSISLGNIIFSDVNIQ